MGEESKMLEQMHKWIVEAKRDILDQSVSNHNLISEELKRISLDIADFKDEARKGSELIHKKLDLILDKNQYTINSLTSQLESQKGNDQKNLQILASILHVNTGMTKMMRSLVAKVDVLYDQRVGTPEQLPTLKDMADAADKTKRDVALGALKDNPEYETEEKEKVDE